MNAALISYGLAAIAFAALCAMVLSRRGPSRTGMLVAASLVSALWAGLAAMDAYHGQHISSLTAIVELLRDAAWLYFLLDLVTQRQGIQPKILLMLRVAGYVLLAYCALLIMRIVADMLAVFPGPIGVSILDALSGGAVSRVILAVMGMALVEQLFRSTRNEDRWSIKYLCFGLGGVLVYDFYLYSDAMLFQHIDAGIWAGRGIVNALAVPLIAISAKRNPKLGFTRDRIAPAIFSYRSPARRWRVSAGHGGRRLLHPRLWWRMEQHPAGGIPVWRVRHAAVDSVLRHTAGTSTGIFEQAFFQLHLRLP